MVISYEELIKHFGGSTPAGLVVRLEAANVKYLIGKSKHPFTTVFALNEAMGLKRIQQIDCKSINSHQIKHEVEIL